MPRKSPTKWSDPTVLVVIFAAFGAAIITSILSPIILDLYKPKSDQSPSSSPSDITRSESEFKDMNGNKKRNFTVDTDKAYYTAGELIRINGYVSDWNKDQPVRIDIYMPDGEVLANGVQVSPNFKGVYSYDLRNINRTLLAGEYKVLVTYLGDSTENNFTIKERSTVSMPSSQNISPNENLKEGNNSAQVKLTTPSFSKLNNTSPEFPTIKDRKETLGNKTSETETERTLASNQIKDKPPQYIPTKKWGSPGTADGKLQLPNGMAVDSSGNIYVADTDNNRVQKFDDNGSFITKWGTYGLADGQFDSPNGVAVGITGNIYVADTNNGRIQKFDSNGNFMGKWGGFNRPEDIAVDSSNNVYVSDTFNSRIQKFDRNGKFMIKWGSSGSGDGNFSIPRGLAIDNSSNVYVSDFNNRIQKFDSNGNFITKWGLAGTADGQFHHPDGVAADLYDNVYVADSANHRIQKFDSNGNFITKWSSQYPKGLAVDSSGNVYLTQEFSSSIQKFSLHH